MDGRNIAIIGVTLLTIRAAFKSSHSRNKLYELFTNKVWIINFLILIAFSIYIYYETSNKKNKTNKEIKDMISTRASLKKALFGFAIAIFSELGLTIAPFWLIFTASYYLDDWI
tara:strand:+ start:283 stop:624 length:342 start_codon:yes stop_codon:yes gene_type:complete